MPIVVSEGQDNRKLKRVGEGLRSLVTRTGDIAYTQSANAPQFIPALFYAQGQDDYAQALALKRALIEEHEGDVLEEIIPGSELVNERGTCYRICLLYTSDAADEEDSVDLGGRRIIK